MKKFISILAATAIVLSANTAFTVPACAASSLLAFPGAEGGGKYTKGARNKSTREVYHVTNLNKDGSGSFKDAVSKEGRIIVFDVGGTIELDGTLNIGKSNLTILGQTAPGNGITFSGGDLLLGNGVKQIIMRHLRIRPTDKNGGEPDGLGGRWNSYVIVDHCSVSWSVDETLTLYAGSSESSLAVGNHLTVQNCISSESMRMSNHFKGAHGYGGIIGGTLATYHSNIFAHHDSRSPRLDRELQSTDVRNNIIYDWGQTNSAYGAEPYSYNNKTQNPSNVNWVANYQKYGPATKDVLKNRVFDVSNPESVSPYSKFYFDGNFIYGDSAVTADNWLGVNNREQTQKLSEPISMGEFELPSKTAQEAYLYDLENAGATLPKRDATDARITDDIKNGTGRIINSANEVGGLIIDEPVYRTFEIPQDWKDANNMGNAKETDIVPTGEFAGYTWIEAYVNDFTDALPTPSNPHITVTSPAISSLDDTINGRTVDNGNWACLPKGDALRYTAFADPDDGVPVVNMELYDSNTLIASFDGDKIDTDITTLSEGVHYLSCRAYSERGEAAQSPTSIVYVTPDNSPEDFYTAKVGDGAFDYAASGIDKGVFTVCGSGTIGSKHDSCGFMYRPIKGDFDIQAQMIDIPKFENGQISGIMVRNSLDDNSTMAMLADGWLKYGENVRVMYRNGSGNSAKTQYFKNSSGSEIKNVSSYETTKDEYRMPKYMRLTREGNTLTFSVSDSGTDWTDNPRQPVTLELSDLNEVVYVGLATDSAQNITIKPYYAMAKYAIPMFDGEEANILPPAPTATPTVSPTAVPTTTPSVDPTAVPTATPNITPMPLPLGFSINGTSTDKLYDGLLTAHGTLSGSQTVYLASYDTSGRLTGVKCDEFDKTYNLSLDIDNSVNSAAVFVWNGSNEPLYAVSRISR